MLSIMHDEVDKDWRGIRLRCSSSRVPAMTAKHIQSRSFRRNTDLGFRIRGGVEDRTGVCFNNGGESATLYFLGLHGKAGYASRGDGAVLLNALPFLA
nr:hypothetical protein CFP56_19379 [Quercus suber]